jgi:uncharacterized membrane protein YccC
MPRRLIFALANTGAVLVALYIAFARDLERPYWAMFTVFIIAKPILGAVRSKAAYRLAGTLMGASMTVFLIPPLVQSPILLCLVLAMWVGLCLFCSLLDRTPRSYALLLAGYTATIIGFSVVNQPETVFDTAVARVEEISLGILCGSLAHSIIFPRNVLREILGQIDSVVAACGRWISEALQTQSPDLLSAERRLTQIVTELRLQYTHVAFESSDTPRSGRLMRLLQQRVGLLLPVANDLLSAVRTLHAQGALRPAIAEYLQACSAWAACFMEPQALPPTSLRQQIDTALTRGCSAAGTWQAVVENTVLFRLLELIDLLADIRDLVTALNHPDTPSTALEDEVRWPDPGKYALTSDPTVAALSAAAAVLAVLIACVLWIQSAWPEGGVAAQFAAIGCSLFATLDRPAKLITSVMVGILLALPLAALYVFAIIPQIDGFPSLAVVLFPVLMLFSLMQTIARLEGTALVLAVGFSGGLALQSSYQANFAAFVNSNTAEVAGLLIAAIINVVFRTIDPLWNAQRIARAGRASVRRLVASDPPMVLAGWTSQMFDRMGLITSRLTTARHDASVEAGIDPLRDLRIGLNLAALRDGIRERVAADELACVVAAVDASYAIQEPKISGERIYVRIPTARAAKAPLPSEHIDKALRALTNTPPEQRSPKLLAALTSLRLNFSADPPPALTAPIK